jgi:dTDP-4-amino-4,6-dideoxygalactose transaminase
MQVKLFDVRVENSWVKQSFFRKLEALYDSENFTLGYAEGPVEGLEHLWRSYCRRNHALGVGAGTHALHMAAFALGLGPGDEVIVPANTFVSTATSAAMVGATIVECDIDPNTLNVTRSTVESVMSDRTRGIFAVNLYGNPYPYDELKELNVPLVEDAAHSHGATYKDLPSGKLGDYSILSFFPMKVFGGIGDSGMILFDDTEKYEALRGFRNCGQQKPHYATVLGNVYRMHVVQAVFLMEKWKIFKRILEHRRRIAAVYDECFQETPVRPQRILQGCRSSYFAYVVRVPKRESAGERLRARGIPWTIQYKYLLHEQPVWNQIQTKTTPVPNAQRAAAEIMSLPMNCSVTEDQARSVAETLLECVNGA